MNKASGKNRSYKSFEDLDCWKACREVRKFITELVNKYPREERFSLVDDMKRAARSTTHNIAEGFGRFHFHPSIIALSLRQRIIAVRPIWVSHSVPKSAFR